MFYRREILCFLFSSKILFGLANNQVAQQREASLIVLPPIILGYDEFYDDGTKDKSSRENDKSSHEKEKSVASSEDKNDKSQNTQDHHGNNNHNGHNHNSQEKNDKDRSDDGHRPKSKENGDKNVGERSHKLSHKIKCRARNGKFNRKSCPFKKKE